MLTHSDMAGSPLHTLLIVVHVCESSIELVVKVAAQVLYHHRHVIRYTHASVLHARGPEDVLLLDEVLVSEPSDETLWWMIYACC